MKITPVFLLLVLGIVVANVQLVLGNDQDDLQAKSKSIKMIGAGLPRTGTNSMYQAMDILGYKPFHMRTIMENTSLLSLWARLANGDITREEVFSTMAKDGFNATMDWPTSEMFPTQMQLYPQAKVVLTVRDNGAVWARSASNLFGVAASMERPFSWKFPNPVKLLFPSWSRELRAVRCAMGTNFLGREPCEMLQEDLLNNLDWLEQQYNQYVDAVKAQVPPEKLLVFNVKEGWAPLCHFLEVPIPDVPFPHAADSAMILRIGKIFKVVTYVWIPFLLLVALVVYRQLTRRGCSSAVKDKRS